MEQAVKILFFRKIINDASVKVFVERVKDLTYPARKNRLIKQSRIKEEKFLA